MRDRGFAEVTNAALPFLLFSLGVSAFSAFAGIFSPSGDASHQKLTITDVNLIEENC